MQQYLLKNWTLTGFFPHFTNCQPEEVWKENSIVSELPAIVPGSVYKDLQNAGIIADPYYGLNSLACEWVEHRWWMYTTEFSSSMFKYENSKKLLCFEGVDNLVSVRLNGEIIARFEGANYPVEIDVTDFCKEHNKLQVIIEREIMENGQFGKTSQIATQKPRYYYKWDFGGRLVNVGIYRNVYLREYTFGKIKDCRLVGEWAEDNSKLTAEIIVQSMGAFSGICTITVKDGEHIIGEQRLKRDFYVGMFAVNIGVALKNIQRWYPNGSGEAKIYDVYVSLQSQEEMLDEYHTIYGFRTIRVIHNEGASDEMKDFLFEVNGQPTYIKGANFVPIDLMDGTQPKDKTDRLIAKMQEMGANCVRVWGGGYIESEDFYESCSRRGIMVWQDFLQSSSGEDSKINLSPEFIARLREVSESAIKRRRNYPCLAVWCGGNELRGEDRLLPITGKNENSQMLRRLVEELDPGRIFFPASPFGGNLILDLEKGTNQNIHGNYKYYDGEYGFYHNAHYNSSNSLFNGEMGVDGVSNLATLKKILPLAHLKVVDGSTDRVWLHLGNWWMTLARDEKFFGKLKNLEDYVYASQFIQAEGLRYAIECNRRRAFFNSGTIIWQLNEPNPSVCNTCVIGYDLDPKQAFYSAKKAFQKVLGCVRYEKLVFEKGEEMKLKFYFVNETEEKRSLRIKITADEIETLFDEIKDCAAVNGRAEELFELSFGNVFDKGIRIDMVSGEYENSVLLLSKGNRGYSDLEYVKRQMLWEK